MPLSQAVLHPTAPLFSPQHQTLKPLCVAALKRIFLMCDKDKVSRPLAAIEHTAMFDVPCADAEAVQRLASNRPQSYAVSGLIAGITVGRLCFHWLSGFGMQPQMGSDSAAHKVWRPCAQDGALNDDELNRFQVKCFNAPLQPEELLGVKKVVQDKMPNVRRPWLAPLLMQPSIRWPAHCADE